MQRYYLGLSLSLCMKDILAKKVELTEISAIVTSTAFESWQEAFEHYFISYWSEFADEETCKQMLQEVWPYVCQPRLAVGMTAHRGHSTIRCGWWINLSTQEFTKGI